MTEDPTALYSALAARDPRFDGVFFVGVTSTGIYCRPVCTARTPRAANCRFFASAAAAEKAAFRPCLRCRPELAPGRAPVDDAHRIATLVSRSIEEDPRADGRALERLAARLGWSARQIRRVVQRELGVSPIELVLTRRLLLAKQLLTETRLPIAEVAFASGFSSIRRFYDAFAGRYGMPPARLRRAADPAARERAASGSFTLQLAYRPPFDWGALLEFLATRALSGVEVVREDSYLRTVALDRQRGWIRVRHAPKHRALRVEVTHSLTPVLPSLLGRLRNLFDLSARPELIVERLARDPLLADLVAGSPGLRVPGAFDGFELAVRAVIGQQVSVKTATTLAGRFAAAYGDSIATLEPDLTRLTPTPQRVAAADPAEVAALGIVGSRARCLIALARAVLAEPLMLEAGAAPEATMERLMAVPGVGPWTAQYIAMRALRWPDAFPRDDVVLRKQLGGVSGERAEELSRAWRPWRSYATLHLWRSASAPDGRGAA